jgi:hypothetical protein
VKFKQLSDRYRNFFVEMSGFVTANLIFFSGIGRYRYVLVYAIYSLLKALSAIISVEQTIFLIYIPATLISIYLDATDGPIFPLYSKNSLIIAFPVMFITDNIIRKLFNKFIGHLTVGQYFVVCPSCHYKNKDLTEKCANCSYEKGKQLVLTTTKISPDLKGNKIPAGLLKLLNIGESEVILFYRKISMTTAVLKNGTQQLRKHFVVTTTSAIFLDHDSFRIRIPISWRQRDIIPLINIVAVEGKMKTRKMAKRPFLIFRTISGDIYEIVFSRYEKYKEGINDIANLIKRANPQVDMKIELNEEQ